MELRKAGTASGPTVRAIAGPPGERVRTKRDTFRRQIITADIAITQIIREDEEDVGPVPTGFCRAGGEMTKE